MAEFYGSIQGARGQATRCGTKSSGLHGHIRGWETGAGVEVRPFGCSARVSVTRTGGSHDADYPADSMLWDDDGPVKDWRINGVERDSAQELASRIEAKLAEHDEHPISGTEWQSVGLMREAFIVLSALTRKEG